MDLVFTSFSPAYRYPAPMTDLERAAASDHYEQGGRVQGCIALGDDCVTVDGLGQRDHSWGPRHWAGIGRWIWAAGQFPSGWCFNIWIVGDGPAAKVVGFVGNGERVIDVVAGAVRWRGGRDGVRPDGADITLALKDGEQRQIEFTTCGYFPLYKDGSDIDESFGRYRCQGEDGAGVIEHLHRTRYRGLTWARLIPRYARLMVRSA
jgi:hypothetical protein